MKKILLLLAACCFQHLSNAQTWEWAHAEPNGQTPSESDAASRVKTDAMGNVYVLGSFLGELYLNNNHITTGAGSYLAKYNAAGTLMWYQLITPDYQAMSGKTYAGVVSIKATDLVVNSSGVFITGKYNISRGGLDQNCNVSQDSKPYKVGSYSFSSSLYDIGFFLSKFTADGNVLWNKTATDGSNCILEGCNNCDTKVNYAPILASDPSNNIAVAFMYSDEYYYPGFVLDGISIPSSKDRNRTGFVLNVISLTPDGNYRWSNTAVDYPGIGGDDNAFSITADNNGNIFLMGQAGDGTLFGTYSISGSAQSRYIAKLSSSGVWQFVKKLTAYTTVPNLDVIAYNANAAPNLLAVDANNNIYVLVSLANLNSSSPQYILDVEVPAPASSSAMYLLKMNTDGEPAWAKKFGFTTFNGSQYGTAIQYANNDLYLTGLMSTGTAGQTNYQFSNLLVPSSTPTGWEYLVARTNLDGDFKWATTFSGFVVSGLSIAVNGDDIYTCGAYRKQIYSLGNFNVDRSTTTDWGTNQMFLGKLKDQYVKVGEVSATTLCPGSTFTLPFTSYGLAFSNDNIFTVQLSDANGSFTNAVNIGSAISAGSGSITATLPTNISFGSSGYRIRIVSSELLNTGLPYYAYADVNYVITIGNQTFYEDADSDGYGNPAVSIQTCSPPSSFVTNNSDCNDGNAAINPNTIWYLDADNDEYYTGAGISSCTSPGTGYKYTGLVGASDCNDNNANVNPGKTEICGNGIDDNCNGQIDEGCTPPPATLPSISIDNVTVYESDGIVSLTVILSGTTTSPVNINYTTSEGTASSAVQKGKKGSAITTDYTAAKGMITIPSGSTTATISILINNDGITEPDESFTVNLSLSKPNSKLATLANAIGTVTIKDGNRPSSRLSTDAISKTSTPGLTVSVAPNPATHHFTISTRSNKNQPLVIHVMDMLGRIIETRKGISASGTITIGEKLRPGTYFVQLVQGSEKIVLKLIKKSD